MFSSDITDNKEWKIFFVKISGIVTLVTLAIFVGLFINNKRLVETGLRVRAQAHFNNIILTRLWNANYGGVYIEKKPGMHSNPYLDNPDIQTVDGKTYTNKNPALMTREISELVQQENNGAFLFHITSLKPLNPDNTPDVFEKTALESFEQGQKEAVTQQVLGNTLYFRYIAPLFVDESCLDCHAKQGYQVGDIRGGISVSFDMMDVQRALDFNRSILIALFILTLFVLLGPIYLFINNLMQRLDVIRARVAKMAVTDELTGLYNRRYFFTKLQEEISRAKRHKYPISCLLIDIDFFKRVNDTYGHLSGDRVLREVTGLLKKSCRTSDTVARYGGEEFIQFLPETGAEGAKILAEKLRVMVESHKIIIEANAPLQITISIGAVSLTAEEILQIDNTDQIVHKADQALYHAKEMGRNRVEFV